MNPTTTSIDSLRFLADPRTTKTEILQELNVREAKFVRAGCGKLAVTYPERYYSYQTGEHILPAFEYLDGYKVSGEGEWKSSHVPEKQTTTLTRYPFLFERTVVKHEGRLILRSLDEKGRAQPIQQYVLDDDTIKKACGCEECGNMKLQATGQSRLFSTVDVCVATNTTTGKLHLLVLALTKRDVLTVISYSGCDENF